MFSRHQKNLSKASLVKISRFGRNFLHAESHAKNGIVPGKAAVAAIINAFVRQIEWREEAHGAAEILKREHARKLRYRFQLCIRFRRNQLLEAADHNRLSERKIIEHG